MLPLQKVNDVAYGWWSSCDGGGGWHGPAERPGSVSVCKCDAHVALLLPTPARLCFFTIESDSQAEPCASCNTRSPMGAECRRCYEPSPARLSAGYQMFSYPLARSTTMNTGTQCCTTRRQILRSMLRVESCRLSPVCIMKSRNWATTDSCG
jgi:hypothetical protein